MVFQTLALFVRSRGPDEFWRKRRIFRLTSHMVGRYRNTYKLAIRAVHKSMLISTLSRVPRRMHIKDIWEARIQAGCNEHGFHQAALKEGLGRCDIHLNNKILSDLAIWEPRTFKSVAKIAWARVKQDGLTIIKNLQKPENVITRGTIK